MLVLDPGSGTVAHREFRDLARYLVAGDVLVLNDTRVIPARLRGAKAATGGRVELLFLERRPDGDWDALMRAPRRPREGEVVILGSGAARAVVVEDGERGRCRLRVACEEGLERLLDREGEAPLPPYIRRDGHGGGAAADRDRYQTVYATAPGAVAAPTAGLHFTDAVLEDLAARGIASVRLTLHVGIGTFRPVTAPLVADHRMEAERYELTPSAAARINQARAAGGRIVAVGSTCVRTLETLVDPSGTIHPGAGRTELFIVPPYAFRAVDMMLTNFHLPRSTLLMMVCAFAGKTPVMAAYREAVQHQYRFFSYGDCMLICGEGGAGSGGRERRE
jgi:S-adenosylmethionine:tRNA ribosyltransferase-isomerase